MLPSLVLCRRDAQPGAYEVYITLCPRMMAEAGRGVPEVQIAERASVARMTVRKALGE